MFSQWVSSIVSYSSESHYSAPASGSWPATNVIGPSNTYPNYGDLYTAWAPSKSSGCDEYLELEFEKLVFVRAVSIYETFHPGAIVRITCRSPSHEYNVLYEGESHQRTLPPQARIFSPPLSYDDTHFSGSGSGNAIHQTTGYVTRHIMIHLDTRLNKGWSEIDAILLQGTLPHTISQTMKRQYASLLLNSHGGYGEQRQGERDTSVPFSDFSFTHYYGGSQISEPCKDKSDRYLKQMRGELYTEESCITTYHLHSVILQYRCPDLYRDMKRQQQQQKSHDTRGFLSHVHPSALYTLLHFIYCDEIEILNEKSVTQVCSVFDQLYPVAVQYRMDRLIQICQMFHHYNNKIHMTRSEHCANYSQIEMSIPVTLPGDMTKALEDANSGDDSENYSRPDICFIVRKARKQEQSESTDNSHLFTKVFAHGAIVCARSAYFHALLTRWSKGFINEERDTMTDDSNKEDGPHVVQLDDIEEEMFRLLLHFMYSGELMVSMENAIHLLMSGRLLLLEDFEVPVLSVIKKGIDEHNIVDLLNMTHGDASLVDIMSMCCEFLLHMPNEDMAHVLGNQLSQELKHSMIQLVPELHYTLSYGAKRAQQYVLYVTNASNNEKTESIIGAMRSYPPSLGERSKYWATEKDRGSFVELEYAFPMFITGVEVCEMGDPDSIDRISILNPCTGTWDDIYERGETLTMTPKNHMCRMFQVPNIKLLNYSSNSIRIIFDGIAIIGSVQIRGYRI